MTFLSRTKRNTTVVAERDSVLWKMEVSAHEAMGGKEGWAFCRKFEQILLRISSEEHEVLMVSSSFLVLCSAYSTTLTCILLLQPSSGTLGLVVVISCRLRCLVCLFFNLRLRGSIWVVFGVPVHAKVFKAASNHHHHFHHVHAAVAISWSICCFHHRISGNLPVLNDLQGLTADTSWLLWTVDTVHWYFFAAVNCGSYGSPHGARTYLRARFVCWLHQIEGCKAYRG